MSGIDTFATELTDYLDADKVDQNRRAYSRAQQAHQGQTRSSGDPYITHPLAVAKILSKMRMDHHSLMPSR